MPPLQDRQSTSGTGIQDWTHRLSVGNAKLDEQHITLLELGRSLLRSLEQVQTRNDQIQILLKDFVGLSSEHDAFEEKILQENGCTTWSEHKLAHEAARDVLAALLSDTSNNTLDKAILARVIIGWMDHHICENDLPVKEYMRMKPGAKTPS